MPRLIKKTQTPSKENLSTYTKEEIYRKIKLLKSSFKKSTALNFNALDIEVLKDCLDELDTRGIFVSKIDIELKDGIKFTVPIRFKTKK
jgi:hypothetical protein